MYRIDAQHSFAFPNQGPDWFSQILRRNRFSGSVYRIPAADLGEALALAERHPYIVRVVPETQDLRTVPHHPLVRSVYVSEPDRELLDELERRDLCVEIPSSRWPVTARGRVAIDGMPEADAFPANVYIKLTGFMLPVSDAQKDRLRRLLRHPGPERLMFASGWPHGGGTWKETLAAFTHSLGAMPIELREQLLGGTAREFYGL